MFFLPRNPLVCMSNMTSDDFSIKLICFWESLTGFMKCTVRETHDDVDGVYERNTFQYSSRVLDRYISEVALEQPPLCSPQSWP